MQYPMVHKQRPEQSVTNFVAAVATFGAVVAGVCALFDYSHRKSLIGVSTTLLSAAVLLSRGA